MKWQGPDLTQKKWGKSATQIDVVLSLRNVLKHGTDIVTNIVCYTQKRDVTADFSEWAGIDHYKKILISWIFLQIIWFAETKNNDSDIQISF